MLYYLKFVFLLVLTAGASFVTTLFILLEREKSQPVSTEPEIIVQRSDGLVFMVSDFNNLEAVRLGSVYEIKSAARKLPGKEVFGHALKLWSDRKTDPARGKSIALLRLALKKGDGRAAHYLGVAYINGFGVKKDHVAAYRFLSDPALDTNPWSLYYRGLLLADKTFSGYDLRQAKIQLQRSRQKGVQVAGQLLDKIRSH